MLKLLIHQSAFLERLCLHCSCWNSSQYCTTCAWPVRLPLGAVMSHFSRWDSGMYQYSTLIYHWDTHGNCWRSHKTRVLSTIGQDVYLWDEHSKGSYACHVGTLWYSSPSRIYWSSACSRRDVAFACIGGEFCADNKRLLQLNLSSKGSWLRGSGVLKIVVMKVFLGLFCGLVAAIMFGLLERMSKEDNALYLMAGKEWEDWAERVPFRLFPSIY